MFLRMHKKNDRYSTPFEVLNGNDNIKYQKFPFSKLIFFNLAKIEDTFLYSESGIDTIKT